MVRTRGGVGVVDTLDKVETWVVHAEGVGDGWLNIVFHNICDPNESPACPDSHMTPSDFDALLDWLEPRRQIGTQVMTIGQAMAPETTIDSGPEGATNDNDPSFAFSSSEVEATFECRLDGPGAAVGTFASCLSPKSYTDLADGTYTFRVRATDPVPNTDPTPATRSFTVDLPPPETTIVSGPVGTTNDNTPTFGFSGSGTGFECRLDGASFAACGSPFTTASLADGPHIFDVRAKDAFGQLDPTPASRPFTVETPPDTSISSVSGNTALSLQPSHSRLRNRLVSSVGETEPPGSHARLLGPTPVYLMAHTHLRYERLIRPAIPTQPRR